MRSRTTTGTRLLLVVCIAGLIATPAATKLVGAADGPRESGESSAEGATHPGAVPATDEAAAAQSQIVVYYFHGERRCKTCRTIEAFAEEVMKSRFAKEIDSGALAWKVVNYDEPANEHFIKDFELVSASLVVVEMAGGEAVRFEVLQQAWSLVRDQAGFDQYVRQSVLEYMS